MPRSVGRWYQYTGAVHIHTTESDGTKPLEEVVAIGRQVGLAQQAARLPHGPDQGRRQALPQDQRDRDQPRNGIVALFGRYT